MKDTDSEVDHRLKELVKLDPLLAPYQSVITNRLIFIEEKLRKLTGKNKSLSHFSSAHEYFGLHYRNEEWIFREWAPNAERIFIIGDFSNWAEHNSFSLKEINDNGIWEICLPNNLLHHGDLYRLRIHWKGGDGDRIPVYARQIHQDNKTLIFNAQVYHPANPYIWKYVSPPRPAPPLIYEAHIGIAQENKSIGTYKEFIGNNLSRIAESGYNTIQLMALMQHPYYGSFGYHVSSFFSSSSFFGSPHELKLLIDSAHSLGLSVLMDIVHSHAVTNEVEGLSKFDGSDFQYFHSGKKGHHKAWDSRCFDYGKIGVLHFLLSNCRFWMDEYHIDGFRFDGITSMLFLHHGLNKDFIGYKDYFDDSLDVDALIYLTLANQLIHEIKPDAITIAEDVSGIPLLAIPIYMGGVGFDYRFAMGIPDFWIKIIKESKDEAWNIDLIWHELNNRRSEEKTISYVESHDQALVGDQSLFFRLAGADCYAHMQIEDNNLNVDRAVALHKMIRLITIATAGNGYLNFMGNEFGHPEWIDFPREGNNWSFLYARRQWSLVDNQELKYYQLNLFDRDMLSLIKKHHLIGMNSPKLYYQNNEDKVIAFEREGLFFVFCFHPTKSIPNYQIPAPPGTYRVVFNSDKKEYGGHERIGCTSLHHCTPGLKNNVNFLHLYLPSRTAIVLKPV